MKFKNFDNYKKKDKPHQLEEEPSEDEQSVLLVDDEPVKKDKKNVKVVENWVTEIHKDSAKED